MLRINTEIWDAFLMAFANSCTHSLVSHDSEYAVILDG